MGRMKLWSYSLIELVRGLSIDLVNILNSAVDLIYQ